MTACRAVPRKRGQPPNLGCRFPAMSPIRPFRSLTRGPMTTPYSTLPTLPTVGLVLKFLHADWRQDAYDRGLGAIRGHLFGRAAGRPAEPREADHGYSDRTDHRSPDSRL